MNKILYLKLLTILSLSWSYHSNAQIELTHNTGNQVMNTNMFSCSEPESWARAFTLSEFGISTDDEFQINSGNIGIYRSTGGERATFQFNIYAIDFDFPNNFSESNLIGSSQVEFFPFISQYSDPEIVTISFDTPVIVPSNIERILIEVEKMDGHNIGSWAVFVAGTEDDDDLSWYKGCLYDDPYRSTADMPLPRPNANFYITVNGEIINNTITYDNTCLGDETEFFINYDSEIESILWDFGDGNSSMVENPRHIYATEGIYDVAATIFVANNSVPEVVNKQIEIHELPVITPVADIISCEDSFGTGISSSFDTSSVEGILLNNQEGLIVTYFDENGNELPSPLPNPMSNSIQNREAITARVSNENASDCFTETTFNLVINSIPIANSVNDLIACDENNDGYTSFDTSNIHDTILGGQTNVTIEYYDGNGNNLSSPLSNPIRNSQQNTETIMARVIDNSTSCFSEVTFDLIVKPIPIAHTLITLQGCDENNDGISEYFDTSNIESQVLQGQTGMIINYFDENGNELISPLPNPFTNSNPFSENITVRITDMSTNCYAETEILFHTITEPTINQPDNLYACDEGNGYAIFNTSQIEQQILGNQTGLEVQYIDSNDNQLPSPLPPSFQNIEPFSQTIYVKVVDSSNPICYAETSFDLIVNSFHEINLEEEYTICDLEPSISLMVNSNLNTYGWYFEDGTLISSTNIAEISTEGTYNLTVTYLENGVQCEIFHSFKLIRSTLPEIQEVKHGEPGNNFIEIIGIGDGGLEYSIDGTNFQDNNYFSNVPGGTYLVHLRDKKGCGEAFKEVTIIDYPKFFTPNNDGTNDYWSIIGITKFPNSNTLIFDRYGKLLRQLSSNDLGWDGYYNEKKMPATDYWFRTNLGNGKIFSGHFSLKR